MEWVQYYDIFLVDFKVVVVEQILSGYGNCDGIYWNFEVYQVVVELMFKVLVEVGVLNEKLCG